MSKPAVCACGRPIVVIRRKGRKRSDRRGTVAGTLRNHDLCRECFRNQKNRDIARVKKEHAP